MGRKGNFAERPVKGPGRKAKKQAPPKFSKKILPNGEKFTFLILTQCV